MLIPHKRLFIMLLLWCQQVCASRQIFIGGWLNVNNYKKHKLQRNCVSVIVLGQSQTPLSSRTTINSFSSVMCDFKNSVLLLLYAGCISMQNFRQISLFYLRTTRLCRTLWTFSRSDYATLCTIIDVNDDKQFHKKRHIGNDHVHIVWCENTKDGYEPSTIRSQFNDAHIVIYPLQNGLFRIQIFKKPKVQSKSMTICCDIFRTT